MAALLPITKIPLALQAFLSLSQPFTVEKSWGLPEEALVYGNVAAGLTSLDH